MAFIAVLGCSSAPPESAGTWSLYRCREDGTLVLEQTVEVRQARAIAVGDLDFDGEPEVVVAVIGGLSVFAREDDGRYVPSFNVDLSETAEDPISALTLRDFDQDGIIDIATVSEHGYVTLVSIRDARNMQIRKLGHVASSSYSIISNDLDRNGYDDLVLADLLGSAIVVLLVGPTGFELQPPTSVPQHPFIVASAHLNDDAIPDIMSLGGERNSESRITTLLGDEAGRLNINSEYSHGNGLSLELTDFDGDGRVDGLVGGAPSVALLSDGSGGIREEMHLFDATLWMSTTDYDRDGRADVVVVDRDHGIGIAPYDGTEFGNPVYAPIPGIFHAAVSLDFDTDGDKDAAVLVDPAESTR